VFRPVPEAPSTPAGAVRVALETPAGWRPDHTDTLPLTTEFAKRTLFVDPDHEAAFVEPRLLWPTEVDADTGKLSLTLEVARLPAGHGLELRWDPGAMSASFWHPAGMTIDAPPFRGWVRATLPADLWPRAGDPLRFRLVRLDPARVQPNLARLGRTLVVSPGPPDG